PSGRFASFDDIIHGVEFFLSKKSGYVNGANLEISGAWLP
ncbi:oxidoreductase, partial [bacterium]|nr:oxidoreductase [bacterium]